MSNNDKDAEAFGKALVAWIVSIPLSIIFSLVESIPIMLALGDLHDYWPSIPALGFRMVWCLAVTVHFVLRWAKN